MCEFQNVVFKMVAILPQILMIIMVIYNQTSNISHTLKGNKIDDHSDIVAASLVGAAPTTSSFLT